MHPELEEETPSTQLTEAQRERIMLLGNAARETLSNPGVQLAFNAIQQEAVRLWASSQPKEVRMREDHYFLVQATSSLINTLKMWAHGAAQLAESEREDDETEDKE